MIWGNSNNKFDFQQPNSQKKVPPALPARGSSTITTLPSSSPKNKNATANSNNQDLDKTNGGKNDEGSKINCDTKQPHSEENIVNESSKMEIKGGVNSTVNSTDGSNPTLKKIYETDMI